MESQIFECLCGNHGKENFSFSYTMADGEVWICNDCQDETIIEEEE